MHSGDKVSREPLPDRIELSGTDGATVPAVARIRRSPGDNLAVRKG